MLNFLNGAPAILRRVGRLFLRRAVIALLLIEVCAFFVAFVLNRGRDLRRDLVYSTFIGMSVWLLADGARFILWGVRRPSLAKLTLTTAILVMPSYYLGLISGATYLNEPLSEVIPRSYLSIAPGAMFSLVMCFAVGWIIRTRNRIAEMQISAAKQEALAAQAERRAVEAQLRLLQAQIEPHMLFNTLANLQGLIDVDGQRAHKMLGHLIQYLRGTLAASREQTIPLAHEFRKLEAYLSLMQIRLGRRLSFTLVLPDKLASYKVPPMLLQPLVENGIKHGIEPKLGGGAIKVEALEEGETLKLVVADTGLGIAAVGFPAHSRPGMRVGLDNVRERIEVLYGRKATLSLADNEPVGTVAIISLPLAP